MWNCIAEHKEFILAIATFFTSVTAIAISVYQLRLSNKHQLFERRLNSYLFISDFITLYQKNRTMITAQRRDEPYLSLKQEFLYLTNCAYLETITRVIQSPAPIELHQLFLKKREEINKIALELIFLFEPAIAEPLKNFILCYAALLSEMRVYQSFIDDIRNNDGKERIIQAMTIEQKMQFFGEKGHRETLRNAYHALERAYTEIENKQIIKQVQDAIRLTKSRNLFIGNNYDKT